MNRVALASALWLAACGHNIGDGCNTNVDCSPVGDRFCDSSSIGGYCTVEGCDVNTCPDGEPCVRFFTVENNEPCDYDPRRPGVCPILPPSQTPAVCCPRPDERCITDADPNAQPDERGLFRGHCAPESSERRWCMHRCGGDGDCRDRNYRCVATSPTPSGSKNPSLPGALPIPTLTDPTGAGNASNFCVQRVQ